MGRRLTPTRLGSGPPRGTSPPAHVATPAAARLEGHAELPVRPWVALPPVVLFASPCGDGGADGARTPSQLGVR
jgi:hypothetical protein